MNNVTPKVPFNYQCPACKRYFKGPQESATLIKGNDPELIAAVLANRVITYVICGDCHQRRLGGDRIGGI